MSKPLFTRANPKTRKGESLGYDTLVLHLAPANVAGCGNVCPHATRGCMAACLNTAGRGAFSNVQQARIRRTRELFPNGVAAGPDPATMERLRREIELALTRAEARGRKLAVRLNGTSDLPFESYTVPGGESLMRVFPQVQFYDYTKDASRMRRFLTSPSCPSNRRFLTSPIWPSNYHLTFSRSESNDADCEAVHALGGMLATVATPKAQAAYSVAGLDADGDAHDLTFLHHGVAGRVLWLTPKSRARRDETGFVLR